MHTNRAILIEYRWEHLLIPHMHPEYYTVSNGKGFEREMTVAMGAPDTRSSVDSLISS
jgi:hypothetical protein